MTLAQLVEIFSKAGATRLYAKRLAENDNSKNQIYFAGAVEALNAFPSYEVYAANTKKMGPTFKARLNFSWLLPDGRSVPAPHAQLILYAQYPEVRFSGFLLGCKEGPSKLLMDRQRAQAATAAERAALPGRVLFLGVTSDRKVLGFVAAGNSALAHEFHASSFPEAFVVFNEIPLPAVGGESETQRKLLQELRRIHQKGWINSKQLDLSGEERPCKAPQCGGFTLEAELNIPKNSDAEPDFLGWEVKQHQVPNFDRPDSGGAITLMTPEPTLGVYKNEGAEEFIRRYGYADRNGVADRMNFGGVHRTGEVHPSTGLLLSIDGYDSAKAMLTDAEGAVKLLDKQGNVAAGWSLAKLLEHWSRKHAKAVYVPSHVRKDPEWQYQYGNLVRLAQGTNGLKFLEAFMQGIVFYDPGIKLENLSGKPKVKKRSQFRVSSKNISQLYAKTERYDVSQPDCPLVG